MRRTAFPIFIILLLLTVACDPVTQINSFSVEPRLNRCPRDTVRVSWDVVNPRPDAPVLRANHETIPDLLSGTVVSGNEGRDVQVVGPDDTTFTLGGGGAAERSRPVTFFRERVFTMNLNGRCSGGSAIYENGVVPSDISPNAIATRLRNYSGFAIRVTHRSATVVTPTTVATLNDPFGPIPASGDYVVRPLNQPPIRCPINGGQPPPFIQPVSIELTVDCR